MLSSLSRLGAKGRQHGERSPFSSPYSGLQSSPVAARRSSLEERRRPAADFDHNVSPNFASRIHEEDEDVDENEVNEEEEDDDENAQELDEDGAGETSPLLPIFSAAHLGEIIHRACKPSVIADSSQMLFPSTTSHMRYAF